MPTGSSKPQAGRQAGRLTNAALGGEDERAGGGLPSLHALLNLPSARRGEQKVSVKEFAKDISLWQNYAFF